MTGSADTRIVFTAGCFNTEGTVWLEDTNAPTATIDERLFRSIFDAVGEQTIDTTGDIDPDVLLNQLRLGPHRCDEPTAWIRLLCRWAASAGLRVRFDADDTELGAPASGEARP